MTKHNKAYKFRLYPTEEQAYLMRKTFGCVRFVYNRMLAERKEAYEKYKDDKKQLKKQKLPTPAKYKAEFEWLKEVDSLALANAQLNLQTAYKNFFRGQNDFPTFKSKKDRKSYTTNVVNGNIMLLNGHIKLPKLKMVRIKKHREITRRNKGSERWHKQRIRVAKLHEKVANQRKNFLHQESKKLATHFDVVAIEDLNMKRMSQALHFGKSVTFNGWGRFTSFLAYKLNEQGKQSQI